MKTVMEKVFVTQFTNFVETAAKIGKYKSAHESIGALFTTLSEKTGRDWFQPRSDGRYAVIHADGMRIVTIYENSVSGLLDVDVSTLVTDDLFTGLFKVISDQIVSMGYDWHIAVLKDCMATIKAIPEPIIHVKMPPFIATR